MNETRLSAIVLHGSCEERLNLKWTLSRVNASQFKRNSLKKNKIAKKERRIERLANEEAVLVAQIEGISIVGDGSIEGPADKFLKTQEDDKVDCDGQDTADHAERVKEGGR